MSVDDFNVVDFGDATIDMKDFFHVEIAWAEPIPFSEAVSIDKQDLLDGNEYIYAIISRHGNLKDGPTIQYIGITQSGGKRFVSKDYQRKMSIGSYTYISFGKLKSNRSKRLKNLGRSVYEELEHIIIWAIWQENDLYNGSKIFTLPGWGANGTQAYHILNSGFGFNGKMKREIIYPWMICR